MLLPVTLGVSDEVFLPQDTWVKRKGRGLGSTLGLGTQLLPAGSSSLRSTLLLPPLFRLCYPGSLGPGALGQSHRAAAGATTVQQEALLRGPGCPVPAVDQPAGPRRPHTGPRRQVILPAPLTTSAALSPPCAPNKESCCRLTLVCSCKVGGRRGWLCCRETAAESKADVARWAGVQENPGCAGLCPPPAPGWVWSQACRGWGCPVGVQAQT